METKETIEFNEDKYFDLIDKEEKAKKALEKQENTLETKKRLLNEAEEKYEKKLQDYEKAIFERKSYLVNSIPEDEFTKVLNKYIDNDVVSSMEAKSEEEESEEDDLDLKELEAEYYDKEIK